MNPKTIPANPNYRVYPDGTVESKARGAWKKIRPGRAGGGYMTVVLGRAIGSVTVHSLVAAAFIGPRPKGCDVRHINGDPSDNRVENLVYGTRSQNANDRIAHGTNGRKLTPEHVSAIRKRVSERRGIRHIVAEEFGVSISTVNKIACGELWGAF